MLSLLAKLGLDTSGFMRGLSTVQAGAKTAGDEIAKSFGSKLKSSLFGGAAVAAVSAAAMAELSKVRQAADKADLGGKTIRETLALERVAERVGDVSALAAEDLKRLVNEASRGLPEESALRVMANDARELERALQTLEGRFISVVAGALRAFKGSLDFRDAAKAGINAFFNAPLGGEDGQGGRGFAGIAEAWANAKRAFANSRAVIEIQRAEEQANAPRLPQLPPKPESAARENGRGAAGRAVSVLPVGQAPDAGGLASAGLFFGGAGSQLYRETRAQTETLRAMHNTLRVLPKMLADEL